MRALRLHFLLALLLCKVALFSASLTAESTVSIRTTDFAPSPDALFSIAGKAEMAVYRAFREKYPNIRPEGNSLSLKLEGPAGEAPLLMSIAGRTAPDVIHVNTRQSGSYIGRNFLLPLDEYINTFHKGIKVSTTRDLRWKRVDIKSLNLAQKNLNIVL